jgi:hypothetical protein
MSKVRLLKRFGFYNEAFEELDRIEELLTD